MNKDIYFELILDGQVKASGHHTSGRLAVDWLRERAKYYGFKKTAEIMIDHHLIWRSNTPTARPSFPIINP